MLHARPLSPNSTKSKSPFKRWLLNVPLHFSLLLLSPFSSSSSSSCSGDCPSFLPLLAFFFSPSPYSASFSPYFFFPSLFHYAATLVTDPCPLLFCRPPLLIAFARPLLPLLLLLLVLCSDRCIQRQTLQRNLSDPPRCIRL